jgi:diguanylate cyclase (GGDEF)-like protein/hemerythrin-like metal-binding protein
VLLFVLSVLTASLSSGYLLNKVFGQLEDIRSKLETLSITDSLTALANRRHFDEVLGIEYGRHVRSGGDLSLIMLDIDFFKAFNDNYGHITGDACLRQVSRVLAGCTLRPADLAARYGGEEFACILPETDRNGAIIIAEQIRRGIAALAIPHRGSFVADHVTASLGVFTDICTKDGTALEILSRADELLYQAKSSGRNRIEIFTSSVSLKSMEEVSGNFVQLVWKDFFCSGNLLIDAEHQTLFQVSNELFSAILSDRPSPEISLIIGRLLADVARHFQDEQMILEKIGFPGLPKHREEHSILLARGIELSQQFHDETLSVGEVFQFLACDVVMIHLLGADREYFPYILNTACNCAFGFDSAQPTLVP